MGEFSRQNEATLRRLSAEARTTSKGLFPASKFVSIQHAISEAGLAGGGVVTLAAGDFDVDQLVMDQPNVTLEGGSGTRLIFPPDENHSGIVVSAEGCGVVGLDLVGTCETYDHGGFGNEAIELLAGADNALVSHCRFLGASHTLGFNTGVRGRAGLTNIRVLHNYAEGILGTESGFGYVYQIGNCNGGTVHSNTTNFRDGHGRHAVYLSAGTSNVSVMANTVTGGTSSAISLYAKDDQSPCLANNIIGNVLINTGATFTGNIQLSVWVTDTTVQGNQILNAIGDGIQVNTNLTGLCMSNSVIGNTITSPGRAGINVIGAESTFISNNLITDASASSAGTYSGIVLGANGTGTCDYSTVRGNVVAGAGHKWPMIADGDHTWIAGNRFAQGTRDELVWNHDPERQTVEYNYGDSDDSDSKGSVGVDDHGDLDADSLLDNDHQQYTLKNGWDPNYKTQVALAFDDGTRTFSLSPTGSTYSYWNVGTKYTVASTDSVVIDDLEGLWFIYYVGSVLTASQTVWNIYADDKALVAVLYWNATASESIGLGYELHSWMMDPTTHATAHLTTGSVYGSGLAPGDLDIDGNGDDATSAQLSIGSGIFFDEDIMHVVADEAPQELSPTAEIPILYREGASGYWRKTPATSAPFYGADASNLAYWNEWTGATWQLSRMTNNDYYCVHIFVTNDVAEPVIAVMGQVMYETRGLARDGAETEMHDLQFGTLALLTPEFVPIASFIAQANTGYNFATNPARVRFRSTDTGDDYVDWRGTTAKGAGGTGATDHGQLSGLDDDDHLHYHTDARGDARYPLIAHTVASHSDTTATGAELEELTDGSVTALHSHAGGSDFIHLKKSALVDSCGGANGTTTQIRWDVQDHIDTGTFGHDTVTNPDQVVLKPIGRYEIKATVSILQDGSGRTTFGAYVTMDGTPDKAGISRNYSRGAAYGDTSMTVTTEIESASASQVLRIEVYVDDADSSGYTSNTIAAECELIVRRIG